MRTADRPGTAREDAARRVKAVLFDLDNTIALEDLATARAFADASAIARGRVDTGALAAAAEAEAEVRWRSGPLFGWADGLGITSGEALWGDFAGPGEELASLRTFAPKYRRAVWRGALRRCGVVDAALASQLDAAFERARLAAEPLDPDAEAVLDELRNDYRLALVTNGAPAIQRAKLALTGLARRFDAVVVSGEIGAGKPDPRVVEAALGALGVGPHEAAMVGDSVERDVAAARAAGVYAVWLDRGSGPLASAGAGVQSSGAEKRGAAGSVRAREGLTGPTGADARITSLRELPALLAGLPRPPVSPRDSRGPRPE